MKLSASTPMIRSPLCASGSPCRKGIIYLDGNSLGPFRGDAAGLKRTTATAMGRGPDRQLEQARLDRLAGALAAKLALIVGAEADELLIADFDLRLPLQADRGRRVGAAGAPGRSSRSSGNFPTDLYVAQGLANCSGSS